MKRILTIAAAALQLCLFSMSAQDYTGAVKGTVVSRADRTPVAGAHLEVSRNGKSIAQVDTKEDGKFFIANMADGMYDMIVKADGYLDQNVFVTVDGGFVKDLIFVSLTPTEAEFAVQDDYIEYDIFDSGYSDAPVILTGGDVYTRATSYGFSSIRFKPRGYNSETQEVYLAGVRLNDAITGYSPYSLWTGVNEAVRSKDTSEGLEIGTAGVGGVNGLQNIEGVATAVRPGWRMSALTNSALYRLRLMASYSSGRLDNGWAYAFNASVRVGGNDWIKGVYYRQFAYYFGAQKSWDGGIHDLSFSTMGTPGDRGAQNASTKEVYDLMHDNMYNSNWGYQNGKVRNARVRSVYEPVTFLKYTYTPSDKFYADATLVWRTGSNKYSTLDWYDAQDPRPDYYRNLPSYSFMVDEDYNKNSETKAAYAEEMWNPRAPDMVNYQHVNWDRLYNVNYNSEGGRSKYNLANRCVDQNDLHLALSAHYVAGPAFSADGGIQLRYNRTENYQAIKDLLGGEYYLDIDSFAERDFAASAARIQNDLDYWLKNGEPRTLKKGDKFNYDYLAQVREARAWASGTYTRGMLKLTAAGQVVANSFWRDGLVRKGLFPGTEEEVKAINDEYNLNLVSNGETSYGRSGKVNALGGSFKLNGQYTFTGGHAVSANAAFISDVPTFSGSFISPRTRNTIISDLKNKTTLSADVNYRYSAGGIRLRATAFATAIYNQSKVSSFYDDSQHSFTNFAMTGINQRHLGVEFGIKAPTPIHNLTVTGVFTFGDFVYFGTPHMKQTMDNSAELLRDDDVPYWSGHPIYSEVLNDQTGEMECEVDVDGNPVQKGWQKHYVPSTPQIAAQLSLNYFYDYWFIELNGQFFAKSYLDMNPLYRTRFATSGPDGKETADEISYMAAQEALKPVALVNFSVGKSWYINRHYNFGFSLSLNNLLNNKEVITGGYEQTRLISSGTKETYKKFDPKYFYMQGFNYSLNLYLRF